VAINIKKRAIDFLLLEAGFSTISLQAKTDEPFDLTPEFKADSAETEDAVLRVRSYLINTAYGASPD
jgi:hypothetical protein